MIRLGSATRAQQTRHGRTLANGFSFHRSEWMESGRDGALSPTVFLVEQPPRSVLDPHFHAQNQFQVVQQGSGMLGPHAVGPGSVHYAGAFTGYGPLVAGPQGLSYFTVRAVFEMGANFLPVARERLQRGPKRHAVGPIHEPLSPVQLSALPAPVRIDLIGSPADELAAYAWHLPALAPVRLPPPRGSGQFQLVMAGEFLTPEATLSRWETRYLSTGEHGGDCRAGAGGLQLLVLQMPARAPEYAAVP
jgi:hypothetical protein